MEVFRMICEILRNVFMSAFGVIFLINLILIFAKKTEDGFEMEILTIAYMIMSLLAIITIKIL